MTDNFTSFQQVANYMDQPLKRLSSVKKKTLKEIGEYLQGKVRASHGKYGLGWMTSTSSPVTPLLKSGGLAGSVSFELGANYVEVYSKNEWLALIMEYGLTYKMTDKQRKYLFAVVFKDKKKGSPRSTWGSGMVTIPARPLWRLILDREKLNIEEIVDKNLNNIF